jgi:hypothetical protein
MMVSRLRVPNSQLNDEIHLVLLFFSLYTLVNWQTTYIVTLHCLLVNKIHLVLFVYTLGK